MEFETGDWVGLRLTSGDLVRGQVFLVGLEGLTVLEDEEFRAVAYSEIGEIEQQVSADLPVIVRRRYRAEERAQAHRMLLTEAAWLERLDYAPRVETWTAGDAGGPISNRLLRPAGTLEVTFGRA